MNRFHTHRIENQASPLEPYNLFLTDSPLQQVLARNGVSNTSELINYGEEIGKGFELGHQANHYPPELKAFDRFGQRQDFVDYHPSYHQLMELALEHGLSSGPWENELQVAHQLRAAKFYCHSQVEAGSCCPVTMSFAAIPVLQRLLPDSVWLKKALIRRYDPSNVPVEQKLGATFGMAMTEKQGGSDVRANTTQATRQGDHYRLIGHKWFCSAPMSDAFLVLAQAEQGLTCFLVPRWQPDGSKNTMHIMRLKDKLGNRSNASSEIEFCSAFALRLGDEGRGVATIIEMVALTRFDCMLGSSGLMRQALSQAIHHCSERKAFGRRLAQQPLMQQVLADLALESEAALVMSMTAAQKLDHSKNDPDAHSWLRLVTAIGKYWICKRAPQMIYEASECLGGAGYVEEAILPRLYREAPVNSIWEGSGNVQCLDVLRALDRHSESLELYLAELDKAGGVSAILKLKQEITTLLKHPEQLQENARLLADKMALALQASLLVQAGNTVISDAFISQRLLHPKFNYGSGKIANASQIIARSAVGTGE